MLVAAYQAPLMPMDPVTAVTHLRAQVDRCEREGVEILCCPETLLGGLGDASPHPSAHALEVPNGELAAVLAPLTSPTVTTIVGFTERTATGALFNSAAVLQRGTIIGVYRKNHPAIRRSIYRAGTERPVFRATSLVFGVLICNDSNFPEVARSLVAQGARALFIPTNNGLPPGMADVVAETRRVDDALAQAHDVAVIRADVAGRTSTLDAYGTSAITAPDGTGAHAPAPFTPALLIADIAVGGRRASSRILLRPR